MKFAYLTGVLALLLFSCSEDKYEPVTVGDWQTISYQNDSTIKTLSSESGYPDPVAYDFSDKGEFASLFHRFDQLPSGFDVTSILVTYNGSEFKVASDTNLIRDVVFADDSIVGIVKDYLAFIQRPNGPSTHLDHSRICGNCSLVTPEQVGYFNGWTYVYGYIDQLFVSCPLNGGACTDEIEMSNSSLVRPLEFRILNNGTLIVPNIQVGFDAYKNRVVKHFTHYVSESGESKLLGRYIASARSSPSMMFTNAIVIIDDAMNLKEHPLNKSFQKSSGGVAFDINRDGTKGFLIGEGIEMIDASGNRLVWQDESVFASRYLWFELGIRIVESEDKVIAHVPGGLVIGRLSTIR